MASLILGYGIGRFTGITAAWGVNLGVNWYLPGGYGIINGILGAVIGIFGGALGTILAVIGIVIIFSLSMVSSGSGSGTPVFSAQGIQIGSIGGSGGNSDGCVGASLLISAFFILPILISPLVGAYSGFVMGSGFGRVHDVSELVGKLLGFAAAPVGMYGAYLFALRIHERGNWFLVSLLATAGMLLIIIPTGIYFVENGTRLPYDFYQFVGNSGILHPLAFYSFMLSGIAVDSGTYLSLFFKAMPITLLLAGVAYIGKR